MKNILLKIEYDGTNFFGWQRQPEVRTVQGEIESVLTQLCRIPVTIDGTGRTDACVHALGQCATFSGEFGIPVDRLMTAANDILAESRLKAGDVRIVSAQEVEPGFHARFSAVGKTYVYRIYNS
ncbi:MAG: tRNA pseudouridine synthase A, partial [Firmicutes bacterium]|nr:tRNA pseudouridine synthase A [Bacillota bacterium]